MSVIRRLVKIQYGYVSVLMALMLCGALAGCGAEQQSGPAQASTTSVNLKITMPKKVAAAESHQQPSLFAKVSQWLFPTEVWAANPSDIVALIVEVTGPGIPSPITKRQPVDDVGGGEVIPIVLDVPVGEGRVFAVSAVNAVNTTIFHGESSAVTLTLGQVATAHVELVDAAIVITTTTLPGGTDGLSYSATVVAENASGTVAWAIVSGTLPSGLELDPSTGEIVGTPAGVGTFTVTVRATDPLAWDDQELSITIAARLTIITTLLHEGTAGAPYSETLETAGGVGAVRWDILGKLPFGLTLDTSTGEITGTPVISCECEVETSLFTVEATDSKGQIATQPLEIVIAAPLFVETTFLPEAFVGSEYLDFSSGTGGTGVIDGLPVQLSVSGGVGPYTWSLVAGVLPTGLSLSFDGIISGVPAAGEGSCAGVPYDTVFEVRDSNGAIAKSDVISIVVFDSALCSEFFTGTAF